MGNAEHDIFLAHAGGDRASAEQLFDLLSPDIRVWLDTKSLMLGDDWPKEIARAQRSALTTVILVSRRIEDAFYARDEIHTAIAMFRKSPDEHRCVPVFLEGFPSNPMELPYGLRGLHGLDARQEGLEGVARKLREMVKVLRTRGAPAPAPAPAPVVRGPEPLTGVALYETLLKLNLGAMLDGVILRAGLPSHDIRPATAPLSQRAIDIVNLVAAAGPELAAKVTAAIHREAPHLAGAAMFTPQPAPAAAAAAAPPPVAAQPAPGAKTSVLLVFANPKGTDPLRLGTEERALRESIKLSSHREHFEVEALHAATIDDLRRALRDKPRTIVHFSGHGESDGLQFEDEVGKRFTPDVAALGDMLRRRGVETVVLNACYSLSIIQSAPMANKFTVAMEGSVSDAGAIEFSRGFYDELGAPRSSVESAYEEGCTAARLKNVPVKAVIIKS